PTSNWRMDQRCTVFTTQPVRCFTSTVNLLGSRNSFRTMREEQDFRTASLGDSGSSRLPWLLRGEATADLIGREGHNIRERAFGSSMPPSRPRSHCRLLVFGAGIAK